MPNIGGLTSCRSPYKSTFNGRSPENKTHVRACGSPNGESPPRQGGPTVGHFCRKGFFDLKLVATCGERSDVSRPIMGRYRDVACRTSEDLRPAARRVSLESETSTFAILHIPDDRPSGIRQRYAVDQIAVDSLARLESKIRGISHRRLLSENQPELIQC